MMATAPEDGEMPGVVSTSPDQRSADIEARLAIATATIRELRSANAKLRDHIVETEIARAGSNQADDLWPLKRAAELADVHYEQARRMVAAGLVTSEQRGKGHRIRVSVASLIHALKRFR